MATKSKSQAKKPSGASPGASETLNKAKAAFEDYRKRMEASGKAMPPFPPPHVPGMAFGPFPPPHPGLPPYPLSSQASPSVLGKRSLFEDLGSMVRLGVEVINAGLTGGLQLIQGFQGHAPGPESHCSCCEPCGCCCHEDQCCPAYEECCCHDCNPSVHGC